ncbi:enoyl-CoA hydratase/isomerase family protein [Roseomonas indoligenes]|uniref:Enoyl-CoA hydratase/isomerase family protein n=1 Tax=Roseomonas indoligenes TaxID=2820811 RepID=A0A940MV51_9PROT|nr:enoyl-CoA hydratase/isomerase family protein [Pararoseomonas indoligenes]MBP0491807.1 enoyl-CoA hydratase/isomerase family protein [Pararoseomonas indoligenes]
MSGSGAVAVERDGDAAILWLNRPERGNALGPELVEALDAALDAALAEGARLIVLRGRGRNFCTGLDLADLDAAEEGDLALRIIRIELLLQRISALPVATMAVAGGRVFGAGADLFAVCDHRLALAGASFAFPGPAFGLVLGTGRLADLLGDTAARRLLLAGAPVGAESALSLGLASSLLEEGAVPNAVADAARAAARLDAATVAALHGRTRRADDDADLSALARSVARPGLKRRIQDYRAAAMAARPSKAGAPG